MLLQWRKSTYSLAYSLVREGIHKKLNNDHLIFNSSGPFISFGTRGDFFKASEPLQTSLVSTQCDLQCDFGETGILHKYFTFDPESLIKLFDK